MRASAMSKFANASALRAQVGLLRYKMDALGTDGSGNALPGTTSIDGTTIGKSLANAAIKSIQTQAQFTDADGAIDNLAAAAHELSDSGQKFNDPRMVKLLNDPRMKAGDNEWFQNQMSSGLAASLTSQQRDYLIASRQARENIMAIRKVIGTGVSVKALDAITATLPGASTPDLDYAIKQITAVKGQLGRLQSGVPQVNIPGRTNQPGAPKSPASPANTDPLGIF